MIGEAWMEDAACLDKDPDIFFPYDEHGAKVARAICEFCPVKNLCLNYAIENDIKHGVFGGTTPVQRNTRYRKRDRRKKTA